MNLDEAILHCEDVMMENFKKTENRNCDDPVAHNCFECAEEHRQLAEWLKELKRFRNIFGRIEQRSAGVIIYKGQVFKAFDDDLVMKTKDKNRFYSFYGFRNVEEDAEKDEMIREKCEFDQ